MPPRRLLRAYLALWMVTGLVLFLASAATVRAAWVRAGHGSPHLLLLGSVEGLAALLFIIPRTFRIGALGLLITIGIAFAFHTMLGEIRGDLLLYAVVVFFALTHGPLTGPQWRVLVSRTSV